MLSATEGAEQRGADQGNGAHCTYSKRNDCERRYSSAERVVLSNSKREPREAAATGSRTEVDKTNCLPLAQCSGSDVPLYCSSYGTQASMTLATSLPLSLESLNARRTCSGVGLHSCAS